MPAIAVSYLAAGLVMGILDFVWLRTTVDSVYRPGVGAVLAEKPHMPAAIAFYLVYLAGVVIFAVRPALADGNWRTALLLGGLFGFFAYATYDLTNLATLKVWSLKVSLLDMAWGAALTGLSATAGTVTGLALKP